MKEAQFSLAEAKFAVGNDINAVVLQNVTRAQTKVSIVRKTVNHAQPIDHHDGQSF